MLVLSSPYFVGKEGTPAGRRGTSPHLTALLTCWHTAGAASLPWGESHVVTHLSPHPQWLCQADSCFIYLQNLGTRASVFMASYQHEGESWWFWLCFTMSGGGTTVLKAKVHNPQWGKVIPCLKVVFYMNLTFLHFLLPRVSNFCSLSASGAEEVQPRVAIHVHGSPSLPKGPSAHLFPCSMQQLESELWEQTLRFRDIVINKRWTHAITGVSELILNLPAMVATGDF